MTHDPRLVEVVARWICGFRFVCEPGQKQIVAKHWHEYRDDAADLLDAINASGTHWVAPWELTHAMSQAVPGDVEAHAEFVWPLVRDAYLATSRSQARDE